MSTDAEQHASYGDIYVTTLYGLHNQRRLVSVKFKDVAVMLRSDEARAVAQTLLAAAETADSEHFLIEFLTNLGGLGDRGRAQLLNEFRAWRAQQRVKDEGDANAVEP